MAVPLKMGEKQKINKFLRILLLKILYFEPIIRHVDNVQLLESDWMRMSGRRKFRRFI